MQDEDFDDPEVHKRWLSDSVVKIAAYLKSQDVEICSSPSLIWSVAPIVSLWSAPRRANDLEAVWIIYGDLPTDWIEGELNEPPREVMHRLTTRFQQIAKMMLDGKTHPTIHVGNINNQSNQRELGNLLAKRAALLLDWMKRPDLWS